jgi:hypothetical protein
MTIVGHARSMPRLAGSRKTLRFSDLRKVDSDANSSWPTATGCQDCSFPLELAIGGSWEVENRGNAESFDDPAWNRR